MRKFLKRLAIFLVVLVVAAGVAFGLYVHHLDSYFTRIEDNTRIDNEGASLGSGTLALGTTYTAMTYNIGFGAYTPDYTFFMDTGTMTDGTPTQGEHGRAASEESVRQATAGAIEVATTAVEGKAPDFLLFQEVDTDSDRSYHVNQAQEIEGAFSNYTAYYATNFHSGFLAYPFLEPHGFVKSGLLTMSDRYVSDATRRSYPIDESFPWKYFDLDRCFAVLRLPVQDDHELVLINSHMSAYDEGGKVRAKQLAFISGVLEEEYAKGNYVVVGGDWNHALCNSENLYESQQLIPDWVSLLGDDDLPDGFSAVQADNLEDVATCRGADIVYEPGVDYTVTVDGFIVSDNVHATAVNVDTGFANSDHNPVTLTFTLGRMEM